MLNETGGPAFPTNTQISQNTATGETTGYQYLSDGMTLRDYFAAKAMYAFISNSESYVLTMNSHLPTVAGASYAMADAMLKAREE